MWITRPGCSASFCWVQVQKAVVSNEVSFFDRIQYLVIKCVMVEIASPIMFI